MKVPPVIIKGNHPQTHQRVAGTRTQTRRRREGVQTVTRQGQKGGDAPTLIRKEEKTTFGLVRERKTGEEWSHQSKSSGSESGTTGRSERNEQDGRIC
jgi:hypothetical protein